MQELKERGVIVVVDEGVMDLWIRRVVKRTE